MMHGHEKSDLVIVAMIWTQSQARVTNALERIRPHSPSHTRGGSRMRQGSRNTRYQADATPYLGRTSTGRIAPALPGALIRSPRRRAAGETKALRGQAP